MDLPTDDTTGGEEPGSTCLRVFGFGNSPKKCHVFCCLAFLKSYWTMSCSVWRSFLKGVFFVPWLIAIQSPVGRTFVALVEFFKGGRGVLVGWMV